MRALLGLLFSRQVLQAFWKALRKANKDDCLGLSKEIAYSAILSFFPVLLTLITLFLMLGDPARKIEEVTYVLNTILPGNSRAVVAEYITRVSKDPPNTILWLSVLGYLWTGSGVICSIQKALNRIYEVTPHYNMIRRRLVAVLLSICVILPLTASTLVTLFAEQIELFVSERYGLEWHQVWVLGHWTLILLTVVLIAGILYRTAVEKDQRFYMVLPGALLSTALWYLLTQFFNLYVYYFGRYDRIYGGLGAVIVLVVWMYLTSLTLLYGAEFNYQLEKMLVFKPEIDTK